MSKAELLKSMTEANNGYLFTSEVQEASVSRTYLASFLRENNYEKVAKGIYVSGDVWPDELYILQKCYPSIVYSGETALYLHSLIDREYSEISITVPAGFSGSRLRERGIVIHSEKDDRYRLGIAEVVTQFGNKVRCYDKERCLCDMIKNKRRIDIQNFQTAMRDYMKDKDKDLSRLIVYAQFLGNREEVMKYVEVLI
jgi:hypothetical protein